MASLEQRMHCIKLFGQRLSARDFVRQVAVIQIRAAILNVNRPQIAGGSKVSMDGAYGKK
jgi:hypothetical protein